MQKKATEREFNYQLQVIEDRGLPWMVDILSGVLTGGNHGGKVKKDPFDDFT